MACEVRDTLGGHFVLLNVKNEKVVFLKKNYVLLSSLIFGVLFVT